MPFTWLQDKLPYQIMATLNLSFDLVTAKLVGTHQLDVVGAFSVKRRTVDNSAHSVTVQIATSLLEAISKDYNIYIYIHI